MLSVKDMITQNKGVEKAWCGETKHLVSLCFYHDMNIHNYMLILTKYDKTIGKGELYDE